jgi:hypothetical protein
VALTRETDCTHDLPDAVSACTTCGSPGEIGTPRLGFHWKTRIGLFGLPLVCISFGRDERGKRRIARGFIAIGNYAVGGVAIGQFAVGIFSVGQFAIGVAALGQLAVAGLVGFGQFAVGMFAVGQFVAGVYAKGQIGWAEYLWSPGRTDMEAVAMFETIEWLVHRDFATIFKMLTDAIKLHFR